MANGEPFRSHDKTTAAHPTLPFGTKLRVKNPDNGRELTVTVKDRGPFVKGRKLDLSLAAARELDYVNKGVTKLMIRKKKR
jgi:rare lipoprotein A